MSHTSLVELNSRILTFLQEKALVNESAIQNKQNELNITTSQELQKTLNELTNTDRLLRVGIIGRVKAGKSSLLNALVFEGNDILPKAATPMTAALTRMEYSEEVRAEMEFYDQADLAEIERKSTQYLTIFEANKSARKSELLKEREDNEKKRFSMSSNMREPLSEAEIEKRAEDFARSEAEKLIELSSAYDQFQRIQQANISREELEQKTLIKADSTAALMGLLNDYVGSSGKYMPFTKSVKLYIPEEGLKGLEIVDTPGVNDPVQSREQRTNEFLSKCDVVFVVSPSGQFLSEEDMRLMGRVTSSEGIKEAYIIASQVDNQLFGSEKENEFSPLNVLKKVEGKLDKQAKEMLSSRKGISEEILALYQKNSIICMSSVAYGIHKQFEQRSNWDSNMQQVWKNFETHYPDVFADEETAKLALAALGDVSKIRSILVDVQARKEEIQAKHLESFVQGKQDSLNEFIKSIEEFIEKRIDDIEDKDLDTERKRLNEFREQYDEMDAAIKIEYQRSIRQFSNMEYKLHDLLDKEMAQITQINRTDERCRIEEYDVKDNGFTNFFGILGDRYKTVQRTVHEEVINAGEVRQAIRDIRSKISRKLNNQAKISKDEWESDLIKCIFTAMREVNSERPNAERLNRRQINDVIQAVFEKIPKASFELRGDLPAAINKAGMLSGKDALSFVNEVDDYIYEKLTPSLQEDIAQYIQRSESNLTNCDISKEILGQATDEIAKLVSEIETKSSSIEKYKRMQTELSGLKGDSE